MADFKPTFNIDASQIFAKLHLAAQQQVESKYAESFIINTAISDPQDKGNPQNVGNTKFDFSNKSGTYEVAIAWKNFGYMPTFDIKEDKELQKAYDWFENNKDDSTEEIVKHQLEFIDEALKKYPFSKENKSPEIKQFQEDFKEAQKFDPKKEEKDDEEEDKTTSLTDKNADDKEEQEDENQKESTPVDVAMKSLQKALKSESDYRAKVKADSMTKWQKDSLAQLKTYFEVFSGKELASKISENSSVLRYIDVDGKVQSQKTAEKQIKNFKIVGLDEKTVADAEQKQLKNKPSELFEPTIAYVVAYDVNSETM